MSKAHKSMSGGYIIFCPACCNGHLFDSRWTFNGDLEKPTFRASMLVRGTIPPTDEEAERILAGEKVTPVDFVCHSFVTDGRIEFLGDCTHKLKGQTVDLPDLDDLDSYDFGS